MVPTAQRDKLAAFTAPDEDSRRIAEHIIDFLQHEVKVGRLPPELLPLQSGVGNIANAVLAGLNNGPFEHLNAYTEVLQDGMLDMLESGKLDTASTTRWRSAPQPWSASLPISSSTASASCCARRRSPTIPS